jgi:hypothetical protein
VGRLGKARPLGLRALEPVVGLADDRLILIFGLF